MKKIAIFMKRKAEVGSGNVKFLRVEENIKKWNNIHIDQNKKKNFLLISYLSVFIKLELFFFNFNSFIFFYALFTFIYSHY